MNTKLKDFAKEELKSNLMLCTKAEQHLFKRMYSHGNLELSIDDVVDNMPEEKLDRAMQQVEQTIAKHE